MNQQLLEILVDPSDHATLRFEPCSQVHAGSEALVSENGTAYKVLNGIPRFTFSDDATQKQTEESFGYKWHQRESFSTTALHDRYRDWMVEKYGFANAIEMRDYFAGRKRILDAGCGAGMSSQTFLKYHWPDSTQAVWYGLDISSAIDVAKDVLGEVPATNFVQADVLKMPFRAGTFDTVFSEGVLHHTPSTQCAIRAASRVLSKGGEILFYVYRKKGPVREFTDDYVRDAISDMPPQDAWNALRSLTKLGQALADLNVTVNVPEDVPLLGIRAGAHDVQRLFYWNVAKVFWNPSFSFEENHHINFDWYHPKYAHRQTEEQVRSWCEEADLSIVHFHEQDSGYTVRAIKAA